MDDIKNHVKSIAEDLGKGLDADWAIEQREEEGAEEPSAFDYLEDVLDINYIINSDGTYKGARVLVAFGGPNIWVDTERMMVDGYWGMDSAHEPFTDNLGLDDALEEMWAMR